MSDPQTRRRWLQFRLRTLLITTALVAAVCGWVVKERRESGQELQLAETLEERGAIVRLWGPYDLLDPGLICARDSQGWWRTLARQVLGERVLAVDFLRRDSFDLMPVTGLTNLRSLSFNESAVTDLRPVAALTKLEWLAFNQTPVTDLGPVAALGNLQLLYSDHTAVTDLGPVAGLAKLRHISLRSTHITDLTPLAGLKNLQTLDLNGCPVSQEQLDSLQKALPNCKITGP